MDTNSPILSDPGSHARLRGLIAPSLVGIEQTWIPSASFVPKTGGKDGSTVPQVLLPFAFGDPKTWTQAEKALNADMKSLFEEAELRPFGDKVQRTGAMVHIMLKHPSVSFHGPDRDESAASNADNQGQGEHSSRAPSAVSQVRRRAENRYIYELRRRLKNNNTALAQGQDPFRFAGKETNCETPGRVKTDRRAY
jgi:hypothetical protein